MLPEGWPGYLVAALIAAFTVARVGVFLWSLRSGGGDKGDDDPSW